jgi:hypothetical protein
MAQPASDSGHTDIADAPPRVDLAGHEGYYSVHRPEPVIRWVETLDAGGNPTRLFRTGDTLRVRIGFEHRGKDFDYFGAAFHTMDDVRVTAAFSHGRGGVVTFPERGVAECVIKDLRLVSGDYALILEGGTSSQGQSLPLDSVSNATQIRVALGEYLGYPGLLRNQGSLAQRSLWTNQP